MGASQYLAIIISRPELDFRLQSVLLGIYQGNLVIKITRFDMNKNI